LSFPSGGSRKILVLRINTFESSSFVFEGVIGPGTGDALAGGGLDADALAGGGLDADALDGGDGVGFALINVSL